MAADINPAGFDADARALLQELQAAGWTGRLSAKNHAIMRSPDGTATCSVPRIFTGRRAANYAAPFRRWQRQQDQPNDAAIAEAEPVNQGTPVQEFCPDCGKAFATFQAMRVHSAHAHGPKTVCPVCGRETTRAVATRHLASHDREPVSAGQLRRDLARVREQLAEARAEAETWEAIATEAQAELANIRAVIRAANIQP